MDGRPTLIKVTKENDNEYESVCSFSIGCDMTYNYEQHHKICASCQRRIKCYDLQHTHDETYNCNVCSFCCYEDNTQNHTYECWGCDKTVNIQAVNPETVNFVFDGKSKISDFSIKLCHMCNTRESLFNCKGCDKYFYMKTLKNNMGFCKRCSKKISKI
jgi:hypothetical protein